MTRSRFGFQALQVGRSTARRAFHAWQNIFKAWLSSNKLAIQLDYPVLRNLLKYFWIIGLSALQDCCFKHTPCSHWCPNTIVITRLAWQSWWDRCSWRWSGRSCCTTTCATRSARSSSSRSQRQTLKGCIPPSWLAPSPDTSDQMQNAVLQKRNICSVLQWSSLWLFWQ